VPVAWSKAEAGRSASRRPTRAGSTRRPPWRRTAAAALVQRAARSHRDTGARARLSELAREVVAHRNELRAMMVAVGAGRPGSRTAPHGWSRRRDGLKPNGVLLRRSPLSDLVELEALRTTVNGRRTDWRTLRVLPTTAAGYGSTTDPSQSTRQRLLPGSMGTGMQAGSASRFCT
jgi:hypothetical protein